MPYYLLPHHISQQTAPLKPVLPDSLTSSVCVYEWSALTLVLHTHRRMEAKQDNIMIDTVCLHFVLDHRRCSAHRCSPLPATRLSSLSTRWFDYQPLIQDDLDDDMARLEFRGTSGKRADEAAGDNAEDRFLMRGYRITSNWSSR